MISFRDIESSTGTNRSCGVANSILIPGTLLEPRPLGCWSIEEFRIEHSELTRLDLDEWLWIENRRLKANFSTLREYSFSSIYKCAQNAPWRNLLLNLRTFGAGATLDKNSPRYPRERLFNALPLLLGAGEAATQLDTRRHLQRQLRSRADDWRGLVAAYK